MYSAISFLLVIEGDISSLRNKPLAYTGLMLVIGYGRLQSKGFHGDSSNFSKIDKLVRACMA